MESFGKRILGRAAERLDLPSDVVAGTSHIEIMGTNTLLLERHKGILFYGTEEIHIAISDGVMKIKGSSLLLKAMDAQALLVTGQIRNVELIY
ncbi:MAG: sporulation protein [Oscillospiraceae bacterium]|nr:sporulation protein [Oscillospiraceae bacterium]